MPEQFIGFINRRYAPPNPPDNTIPAISLTSDNLLNDGDTIHIKDSQANPQTVVAYAQANIRIDPNHGTAILIFISGWKANTPNPATETVHGYDVYKVT